MTKLCKCGQRAVAATKEGAWCPKCIEKNRKAEAASRTSQTATKVERAIAANVRENRAG